MKTTITPKAAAVQPLKPELDDAPEQCSCPNCDWEGTTAEMKRVYPDIPDLSQRMDPGEECPAGECPKCGALCHEDTPDDKGVPSEIIHALELAATELNKQGCECDCESSPLQCPVCAVNAALELTGARRNVPFPDLTKNLRELDRKRMAGLLAEAAGLADETAQWLSGDESYDPAKLAEALTKLAMDCREASNKVQSLKIIVEVSGGVAEVTTCPTGVEVEIVDHDNAKVGL